MWHRQRRCPDQGCDNAATESGELLWKDVLGPRAVFVTIVDVPTTENLQRLMSSWRTGALAVASAQVGGRLDRCLVVRIYMTTHAPLAMMS